MKHLDKKPPKENVHRHNHYRQSLLEAAEEAILIGDNATLEKEIEELKRNPATLPANYNNYQNMCKENQRLREDVDSWEKAYDELYAHPSKCPVHQCGGFLEVLSDSQTPDLRCKNCGAWYKFVGFEICETPKKFHDKVKQALEGEGK